MSSKWKETLDRLLSTGCILLYTFFIIRLTISLIREEELWTLFWSFWLGFGAWFLSGCDRTTSNTEANPKVGFKSDGSNDGTIGYRRLD